MNGGSLHLDTWRSGMDLRGFVRGLALAVGGLGEERDDLTDLALPPSLALRAGLPDFLTLAFDGETAREQPGAELVTFGSATLDKLIALGLATGRAARKYAVPPSVRMPSNLLGRIEERIGFARTRRPSLVTAVAETHTAAACRFTVTYLADDKLNDLATVLIDAQTLSDHSSLLPELNKAFYTDDPAQAPELPAAASHPYRELLAAARDRLGEAVLPQFIHYQTQSARFCLGEILKLFRYFEGTLQDLEARSHAAEDPEKKTRLARKIETTRDERDRRLDDVIAKYRLTVEAKLDSTIVLLLPKVKALVEAQHKDRIHKLEILYNLATNIVEPFACPRCRSLCTTVHPAPDGGFDCGRHGEEASVTDSSR